MSIAVRNISKTFGQFAAVRNVSLRVKTGELVALLGPSGSGKTTLLRIIAGLERPDPGSGPIRFEHEDMDGRGVRDRQVGFVFQHYALFRHMTVFENVAFGLRVRPRKHRPPKEVIRDRVRRLLATGPVGDLRRPLSNQLSGGQRQRVALARALAIEPQVLLLDEPFGSLDAKVRKELRAWLRRLHDEIHVTSVFVTHDQEEALELADRVVVMNQGQIEQIGTPDEVFHAPTTEFVTTFLGQVNFFRGRVEDGKLHFATLTWESPEHAQLPAAAGAGVRASARLRGPHAPQRGPELPGHGAADPLGRAERAAGIDRRIRRAPPGRASARRISARGRSPSAARSTSPPAMSRSLPKSERVSGCPESVNRCLLSLWERVRATR